MIACFGLNLAAQDWYHDRDQRFHGEEWRGHLFEHVRTDLEYVSRGGLPNGKEAHRLERTKEQLRDLQATLENHQYDERELNDAIDSIRKSANDDRMPPRDKDILHDDLNKMIDYRAHHDHWGR